MTQVEDTTTEINELVEGIDYGTHIEPSALDLRAVKAEHPEAIVWRFRMRDGGSCGDALFLPNEQRLGVAVGGDAQWIDCATEDDIDAEMLSLFA